MKTNRDYYRLHPEKMREYNREYNKVKKHKDKNRANHAIGYRKNPNKHKEWSKNFHKRNPTYSNFYYKKNLNKLRKINRSWKIANPDKVRQSVVKRRALKFGATIGDPQAIAKIYTRARELRQWFNVVVDHIVPLSKGGAHSVENLQIIYATENLQKNARLNYVPKVIFI